MSAGRLRVTRKHLNRPTRRQISLLLRNPHFFHINEEQPLPLATFIYTVHSQQKSHYGNQPNSTRAPEEEQVRHHLAPQINWWMLCSRRTRDLADTHKPQLLIPEMKPPNQLSPNMLIGQH